MRVVTAKKDDATERRILRAMIFDPVVLAAVAAQWRSLADGRPQCQFRGMPSRLIADWCIRYYRQHKKAPGPEGIHALFDEWATNDEKATTKTVGYFLWNVEEEEELETELAIDLADRHFQTVALEHLSGRICKYLEQGKPDKAREYVMQFEPPRIAINTDTQTADTIQAKPIRWLWYGWFACSELSLVDGDPDTGKSQALIDLAARITRGWQMPPADRGIAKNGRRGRAVILLSAEDAWETTIVPRLTAVEADLTKVIKPTRDVLIPRDLGWLSSVIRANRVRLLVIDPITAFVGKIDGNAETQVRGPLSKLRNLANETGAAIALVRHFKKEKARAIHRGGGSIAWTAACRLQHVVGKNPENPNLYVLANAKNNLAPKPKALCYKIVSEQIGDDIGTSYVVWTGESDIAPDEIATPTEPRGRPSKVDEAAELIQYLLSNGPMDAKQLEHKVIAELGISRRTYANARKQAGVTKKRNGFGANGRWLAGLPD